MQFKDSKTLDGVKVWTPAIHSDGRGWLCEIFRSDDPDLLPAMGYISVTAPGATRGPHEHRNQTDKFCFLGPGRFLLVLWDPRGKSPTKGGRLILTVGDENKCLVVAPPGTVHAYANIGKEPAYVINLPDKLYAGRHKGEKVDEIRHEDEGTFFAEDFKRILKSA